jgi:hypothetical protein
VTVTVTLANLALWVVQVERCPILTSSLSACLFSFLLGTVYGCSSLVPFSYNRPPITFRRYVDRLLRHEVTSLATYIGLMIRRIS